MRIETSTTISDSVKEMMRKQLKAGWTAERVGYEMQRAGHAGWSAGVVHQLTRPGTRALTVDEAVGLMAVFKSRAQVIIREADRVMALLTREEKVQ